MPNNLGAGLLGKAREAIIGVLFTAPTPLHVREIARRAGFSAASAAVELRHLERLGVVRSTTSGRQVSYAPDPACPLHKELASIAGKTWGIRGRVARALEGIQGIEVAFIFGSVAAGTERAGSDVDVMVLGSADYGSVSAALLDVTAEIDRQVNGSLYRPIEWADKVAKGNSFVRTVLASPKVFLAGDEEMLDALSRAGKTRRTPAADPARPKQGRDRKPRPPRARPPGQRKASRGP